MKNFKCENCGAELVEKNENYFCEYCKITYRDDTVKKAYEKVRQSLYDTFKGILGEEILRDRLEKIANARHNLYKARTGSFIRSEEVLKWAEEILKLSSEDVQAEFYSIAAQKRYKELNKFMRTLNARENASHVLGFVEYLTNGRFDERCLTDLNDMVARAFDSSSKEYADCHKKITAAVENENSGTFDVELSRDVFVAYSSKDKEKAYELVEFLEENGFTCFLAMRNLAKGVDAELKYNERLKTAMDNCRVFLLVSSKNSRSRNCDAYRIEMQYVKDSDVAKSSNPTTAKSQYATYLEKNRARCKPRVEYLIEDYGVSPYENEVKAFFCGLTWQTTLEGVLNAVFTCVENADLTFLEETSESVSVAVKEEREEKAAKAEKSASLSAENSAKRGSSDFDLIIPDSTRMIYYGEFENRTSLLTVVIPDSVTVIESRAFLGCSNLTKIFIPKSVVSIDTKAFLGCDKLTIYAEATKRPKGWIKEWVPFPFSIFEYDAPNWNPDKRPVKWGATKADFDKA
ncbi:MAG: leucine-rich repeat protein [Clostridia bacterium]|nr:leucine-rich repeat protein [Clostridia bacterium]